MNVEQVKAKLDTQPVEIETLRRYWASVLPNVTPPNDAQFGLWLAFHGFPVLHWSVRECGKRNAKLGFTMTQTYCLKFISDVSAKCPRSELNQPAPMARCSDGNELRK